ncbi:MAG: glycosyltransferase family 9 protein [Bacteroidales bacterium]|jgi:heptosyltransferase-2|nr:glycosyltransferase family 9 protein [Bacteroidales bacterium]
MLKKILVIQTASIGDVVLATSLLETLHRDLPFVQLDIVVKAGNESLFEGHPFLNKVFLWQKRQNKYRNLLKLIGEIRTQKYDITINLQRFLSSGMITLLSNATEMRGFKKNPLAFLFSKRYEHTISSTNFVHETVRNAALIADLCRQPIEKPKLYPDFETIFPFQNEGVYYTISPSSLWVTKQMPLSKWAELVSAAAEKGFVCLLGARNDWDLCEKIIKMSAIKNGKCLNLCGELSFLQSCSLMKRAKMNFTNDSAPLHFCSAVNASVTAVFCSTVTEFGFTPLSEDSLVVQTKKKLSCRPCGLHGYSQCPKKHFDCGDIDIKDLTERL